MAKAKAKAKAVTLTLTSSPVRLFLEPMLAELPVEDLHTFVDVDSARPVLSVLPLLSATTATTATITTTTTPPPLLLRLLAIASTVTAPCPPS